MTDSTQNAGTPTAETCLHDWQPLEVPPAQLAFCGRQPYQCSRCGETKYERAQ